MEFNMETMGSDNTLLNKYLTFVINNKDYAIAIKHVTEIIGIQNITDVPELPSYIKGIINLRGKIIPVMDVRLRFGIEPMEYNDRTCIVVIDIDDILLGLIVDNVSEVMEIPEENIVIPPETNKTAQDKYVESVGKVEKDVRLIISCERLISDKSLEKANKSE